MKALSELYEKHEYERFVQEIEKISPPKKAAETLINWMNEEFRGDQAAWYHFYESLSTEQIERLNHLASSKKQEEYLLKSSESRALTKEEWADLRACDF